MSAHIDVVKAAATGSLDGLVDRALFARRLLAVLGSILVVFSLGASLVLVPAVASDQPSSAARPSSATISEARQDAARAARSRATTAARTAKAAPRPPR